VIPESDIRVVTPNVFMLGNESLSVIASARFFSPLEHAGNKTNITVVQTATVMFKNIKCDFCSFSDDIII
jgi:hypothetical protein